MENDTELAADLNRLWPETNANFGKGDFYQHEYEKHGVCWIQHMINHHREAHDKDPVAFEQEMYKEYFRTVIRLTKQLHYQFYAGEKFEDKDDFAKKLGLKDG